MEIRARYILMGLFLIVVTAGVFGFVYWLQNAGGFGERARYRITFDGAVPGLYTGSGVLFNGIRVGEVTALRIRVDRPDEVAADIAVNPNTPIRTDTMVDLEYQGLTGVAAISLTGGKSTTPLGADEGIPILEAKSGAGTTITQSARDALIKLNSVFDDNSEPLKETIASLRNFSGALSRNSDKVDGILAGLERMTGGARGPDTDKVFELAAAGGFPKEVKKLRGQLMVTAPTAIFQLDTQNILFRTTEEETPLPPGPRWADNLTRLVQVKLAQSFENAGHIDQVSQTDAVAPEFNLLIDIRRFQIVTKPQPKAEIAFAVRITDSGGKIVSARSFDANAPAKGVETAPAVTALNDAFRKLAGEIVTWTVDTLEAKPGEEPQPEPAAPAAPAAPTDPALPAPGAAPEGGAAGQEPGKGT
jgi:phospholipid/cholesterol/gamma-HCH transport system substrate-binding protein